MITAQAIFCLFIGFVIGFVTGTKDDKKGW